MSIEQEDAAGPLLLDFAVSTAVHIGPGPSPVVASIETEVDVGRLPSDSAVLTERITWQCLCFDV